MQELYLIRHAQTETNLKGAFTGQLDIPLTAEGERQATAAGERLRSWGWQPDVVATSHLIRTQQTARLVVPGCEIEIYPGFAEVNMGILEGYTFKEAHEKWPELMDAWVENRDPIYFRLPGAETNQQVFDRSMDALHTLLAKHRDAKRILIVTHSTVVSMLLSGLTTGGSGALMSFAAYNAKFATVQLGAGRPKLTGLNL